jgi:hypothetical protein
LSGKPEEGVVKPTAAQLRQLRKDNAAYPEVLVNIPVKLWPVAPFTEAAERRGVMRSRKFLVQLFWDAGALRMSVNRTEWDERRRSWREDISWDDLQRLKAEAGYGGRWMVEMFPPDSAVVNVANMRHLWLLDRMPDFGWNRTANRTSEAA